MSPYLIGIAVAVIGGFGVWQALVAHERARLARSWPRARGEVVRSHVQALAPSLGLYETQVAYEYFDGAGVRRSAQRVAVGSPFVGSLERAAERSAQYPIGAPIEVTYNPRRPWEAFLELRVEDFGLTAALGATCMVCGAALAAAFVAAS